MIKVKKCSSAPEPFYRSYHYNDNMINIINPYMVKIVITCRQEDSIRQIARRISVSYGWTYTWMKALAQQDVVRLTRMKAYLNEKNKFYRRTIKYIYEAMGNSPSFYYEVLSLWGIAYCFTQTDAVYVWTKGGYNIGRYRKYYPIFIKVERKDKETFEWYCRKLGLKINKKQGIFFQVQYVDSIQPEYYESMPVESRKETIRFMKKHRYNFMPALEMMQELQPQHQQKTPVKYQEVATNV